MWITVYNFWYKDCYIGWYRGIGNTVDIGNTVAIGSLYRLVIGYRSINL